MNKLGLLSEKDSEMMHEFSRRCVGRLETRRPMKALLSPFHHFLEANVVKEVEKDSLIIECAVGAFDAGTDLGAASREQLFEKTKLVDTAFIKKLHLPFFSIDVRYQDFAEIRKKRIDLLFRVVYDLLRNWKEPVSFPALVRATYSSERFGETILEILHLYTLETRKLGSCIKLPPPLGKATDHLGAALFAVMGEVAGEIVREYTGKIFGAAKFTCQSRT